MSIRTGTEIGNSLAVPLLKRRQACARKAASRGKAEAEQTAISLSNARTPVPIEKLISQPASKEPDASIADLTKKVATPVPLGFLEELA